MAWIEGNFALTTEQMENNARELYAYFSPLGFTVNAICGMLGNMWRESTVNPGVWQDYTVNYKRGFGLVQWTPAGDYISWAQQNGLHYDKGDTQCRRIKFEYDNGLQYYKTSSYPLNFKEFAASTQTPEYLAEAFLYNYERAAAATADLEGRKKWARYFYELLEGETPDVPEPDPGVPDPPDPSEKPEAGRERRKRFFMITKRRFKRWQT